MQGGRTISAKSSEESGATSDGFSTQVQPAARAGAALRHTWFIGQFHGAISAATPIGTCASRSAGLSGRSGSSKANSRSTRTKWRRWPSPAAVCAPLARLTGAPISCEIAAPISAWRAE